MKRTSPPRGKVDRCHVAGGPALGQLVDWHFSCCTMHTVAPYRRASVRVTYHHQEVPSFPRVATQIGPSPSARSALLGSRHDRDHFSWHNAGDKILPWCLAWCEWARGPCCLCQTARWFDISWIRRRRTCSSFFECSFLELSNYEKPKNSSNTILVSDDYLINHNLRVVRYYTVTFAKETMTKRHANSKT